MSKFFKKPDGEPSVSYLPFRWVIAFMQSITDREYLPVLLGSFHKKGYTYDSTLEPTIANEFSHAAFR